MSKEKNILINYCLYFAFFFLVIFIGVSNVLAYTYSEVANVTNKTSLLVETSYSSSPFTVPANSSYNFNSVKKINIIVDNYSFQANTNYQLEFALTNQTLEFANAMGVIGNNGEICKMDANASLLSGSWLYFAFQCTQATSTITIEVKNINNTDLWNGSGIFSWDKSVLRSAPEPIGTTPTDTDNIINNQNANTQAIINSFNNNLQSCKNRGADYVPTFRQGNYGTSSTTNRLFTSNNFKIEKGITYTISTTLNTSSFRYAVQLANRPFPTYDGRFYDSGWKTSSSFQFTPSQDGYLGIIISRSNDTDLTPSDISSASFTLDGGLVCVSKLDETNNSINDLNDSLNDDNTDGATSEASNFFSDFDTNTFGLTSIITAPLNLIQSLTSTTCTPLHLPLPYLDNKYLDLPCMSTIYSQHFGTFFTLYQTITYGIIAYWVCVRIFNHVKDFKNPEHDEIEVVEL